MSTPESYGWTESWQALFDALPETGLEPARVAAEHRGSYRVITAHGDMPAVSRGRLRHAAGERPDLPVVGDFVALRARSDGGPAAIHAVLPRRTLLRRGAAGGKGAQPLAANVDVAFLATALDRDFNPSRLERYLVVVAEGGVTPVIVATKADLVTDRGLVSAAIERVAPGAPVHFINGLTGEGVADLVRHLHPSRTAVVLGSSGVGKSTLINQLLGGDIMATGAVRESDSRGRHTTTSRQMLLRSGGGIVIDTPGMREIAPLGGEDDVEATFADIAALALGCRFKDCRHEAEPDCAVCAAVEDGRLDPRRLKSYRKLSRRRR